MNLIIVSCGNFFSNYGGGQVYCRNLIELLINQQNKDFRRQYLGEEVQALTLSLFSLSDEFPLSVNTREYQGITIYEINNHCSDSVLKALIKQILPDAIHINGMKYRFVHLCKELNVPSRVTAHHGGILCPAGTLLNTNDSICATTVSYNHCLPCVLRNMRGGMSCYPYLRHLSFKWSLRLAHLLQRLPFFYFVTPIGKSALFIQNKITEWQYICQNADELIAPSYAIAEAMQRNGANAARIKILPHTIPSIEVPSQVRSSGQPIRFYYAGRINYVKGIHVLLEAFDQATTHNGELHIIGNAGNKQEKRYMQNLQRKYAHNQSIIWHGQLLQKEMFNLISCYDVMIHPTICLEVFGLNIAEALAMKKWIIATRCGGAEMQIIDGVNGNLVPPNNTQILKKIITKLSQDYDS